MMKGSCVVLKSDRVDLPKAMIVRDSFTSFLVRLFVNNFSSTAFVWDDWKYAFDKELILKHENSSLRKELENATEEIRLKSLKIGIKEKGIKENNDILDDDLTIIGIGK